METMAEWFARLSIMDMVLLLLLLIFGVRGLLRGFSGELAHLFTFFALAAGFIYALPPAVQYLEERYGMSLFNARTLSTLVLLLAVAGIFFLLREGLATLVKAGLNTMMDKLLGLITGLLRGSCILLVFLVLLRLAPVAEIQTVVFEQSRIGSRVKRDLFPMLDRWLNSNLTDRAAPQSIRERPVWE